MPIKVMRVADLFANAGGDQRTLKIMVAGPPGAGKTLFASTFPNVVYADMEGRMLSVRNRDVRRVKIETVKDLEDFRAMVDQDPDVRAKLLAGPVDTVVLDTVDEMTRIIMRDRLREENLSQPRIQDWGHLADTARAMLRGFRNLPVNVIMNVHIKDVRDEETGRVYFKPDIQGAVGNEIAGYVDESFLIVARGTMDVATGNRIVARHLQTYPDPQHDWVKDHSGSLPPELEINFNDDYARIYKLIFAEDPPSGTTSAQVEMATSNGTVKAGPDKPVRKKARPTPSATEAPAPPVAEPEPEPTPPPAPEPKPQPAPAPEPAPEPEPEVAPAPAPVPEKGTETSGPTYVCAVCGETIDNPDVAEVSEIRFGQYLCRQHFIERRDRK